MRFLRRLGTLVIIIMIAMISGMLVMRDAALINQMGGSFSKENYIQGRPNQIRTKPPCRSLSSYATNNRESKLDSTTVDNVKLMVLFIGYPRSGHTLVGSLLDAHPNVVIANEYNILEKWDEYSPGNRNKHYVFQQLYFNSFSEANKGDRSNEDCSYHSKYNYVVPNQWQGKFNKSILVIGDKKGGRTSFLLQKSHHHLSALKEISRTVKIPIKFIHVVRNPFDNMATMILRQLLPDDTDRQSLYKNPLNVSKSLQRRRAKYYMDIAKENKKIIDVLRDKVITVKSEELIENVQKQLLRICKFLQISCSEDYLKDCASIVYASPSKTRNTIIWDHEAKNIIFSHIKQIPFFRSYTFDQ